MPVTAPARKRTKVDEEGLRVVREVFRPPDRLRISEWAERNRFLGDESSEPGRWRNRRTPYLVEPMDAFGDPETEIVVLCFAAQLGKTEALLNFLGYSIDQDPSPTLLVYANEKQADKVIRHRVQPMILGSPAIRRHLEGNSDDLGLKEINLDRMTIWTAWSGSPAALSSTPIGKVLLDEVDKFPAFAGREANPIKLAEVRTRTFVGRRKIGISSTPTLDTGYIWMEFERSDRCRYFVPCPRCGKYQVLEFKRILWPKGARGPEIKERRLAWYDCERCRGRIEEDQRMAMVERGRWVPGGMTITDMGELEGPRPSRRRRGFQLSALYSPFVTFSEAAAEFLDCYGDASLLQNFHNSWLAIPWREKLESVTEEKIRAAKRAYAPGAPPAGARVLTAGVDVQADVFWYSIRAWGDGERSWLVRHGFVATWEELWKVLSTPYGMAGGSPLLVQRAYVDSGFRTDEVYKWTTKHRPVTWPSKGSNNATLVQTVRTSTPAVGVLLWTFKTDFYKDRLSRLIAVKPGEPGEWMVHQEIDEDYIRQMTSERRVIIRNSKGQKTSTWEPLTEGTPNHLFDCEVLNVLAAEHLGVKFLTPAAATPPAVSPPAPAPEDRKERGGGWLGPTSDWLGRDGERWLG